MAFGIEDNEAIGYVRAVGGARFHDISMEHSASGRFFCWMYSRNWVKMEGFSACLFCVGEKPLIHKKKNYLNETCCLVKV